MAEFKKEDIENTYLFLCSKLNKKPEECLFIDDYKPNIIGAKAEGLNTTQFTNNKTHKALARHLPNNANLRHLDLSANNLTRPGAYGMQNKIK